MVRSDVIIIIIIIIIIMIIIIIIIDYYYYFLFFYVDQSLCPNLRKPGYRAKNLLRVSFVLRSVFE